MDDLKQKLVTWFVEKFAARAVLKVLSAAAVAAVAHGWMKQTNSSTWVSSNAEMIIGGIAWGLTWLLTRHQHVAQVQSKMDAVLSALKTPPPAPVDAEAVARAIIEAKTPNGL